ncbi:class I SAM-dependent methyltransferase [Sphingomonas sp.]|uniref:class I SAM-dependent methyltransferase n=1 Tax=Sphingomonas sp. TaxID=28214 RepID=UPI002DD69B41|nr:class I SAM-dependent methyltransferase [Sphingomonas sp.]
MRAHLDQAYGTGRAPPTGLCLEIGPGDSLYTACSAHAAGFSGSILVDAGAWADRDLEGFRAAARVAGIAPDQIARWGSIDTALADLNSRYLTTGIDAMRSLADNSVDFIFSQAVLEHIRRHEYDAFIAETRRVLKPGGRSSHRVDLQDHLAHDLNNLRFGHKLWESDFFTSSGFYTNRLSYKDHVRAFEAAGYRINELNLDRFTKPTVRRAKLAREFRDRSDDELTVMAFDIVAEKPLG